MIDEAGILMAEAVVILPPHVRRQQVVERRDRPAPRNAARRLEPLRVLIEHRVDDVNERFIAGEEAVTSRQQVAFEPSLAQMLAEHFHDASLRGEVLVGWQDALEKYLVRRFVDSR